MKCIKCGKEIDNKSTACEYCGMLFTPVMKRKMLEREQQLEEYNKQMAAYNKQLKKGKIKEEIPEDINDTQTLRLEDCPVVGQPEPEDDYDGESRTVVLDREEDKPETSYMPNFFGIVGSIAFAVSLFLPYSSSSEKLTDTALYAFLAAAVVVLVASFVNNLVFEIIELVVSICLGGWWIAMDIAKGMVGSEGMILKYGGYINLAASVILVLSGIIWLLITHISDED